MTEQQLIKEFNKLEADSNFILPNTLQLAVGIKL